MRRRQELKDDPRTASLPLRARALAGAAQTVRDHHAQDLGKAGIRQAGFWTVAVGDSNNDLYYLLAWESLAEREKKWASFQNDPEWIAKRAETEKDGPILNSLSNLILQPTAFSSVK